MDDETHYRKAIELNPEAAEYVAMPSMAAEFNRRNRKRRGV